MKGLALCAVFTLLAFFAGSATAARQQSRDCAAAEEFFAKCGVSPGKLWGRGRDCCGFEKDWGSQLGGQGRVECRGGRVVEMWDLDVRIAFRGSSLIFFCCRVWNSPPAGLRLVGHLDSASLTAITFLERL